MNAEGCAAPPSVTGGPLRWLRLEGLTLLACALLLFPTTHQPWWLIPVVIGLPDLSALGYLGSTRLGATLYNLGHSSPLPAVLALTGLSTHHSFVLAVGLVWLAHIGLDRAAGYGLKYASHFQHTHLGELGTGRLEPV
jgi:Domain of unknown function (DUF4260)